MFTYMVNFQYYNTQQKVFHYFLQIVFLKTTCAN